MWMASSSSIFSLYLYNENDPRLAQIIGESLENEATRSGGIQRLLHASVVVQTSETIRQQKHYSLFYTFISMSVENLNLERLSSH